MDLGPGTARRRRPPPARQLLTDDVPATPVQTDLGRQLHGQLFFRRITAGRCHREDEPSLPQTHPADQHRLIGTGQYDHIAYVDVTGQDHIFHE